MNDTVLYILPVPLKATIETQERFAKQIHHFISLCDMHCKNKHTQTKHNTQ
jgi:hypothetical protein